MYEFVRGPLVWIAFFGFIGGSLFKVTTMLLLARKEKGVFPTWSAKFGFRSLFRWSIPFSPRITRMRPFFTLVSFAFHFCLLFTPLFLMGHAVLWYDSWGIQWWSMPDSVADALTLVVLFGCLIFGLRRIASPEVRYVTSISDWLILLLVVAPYLTGILAHHHQVFPYKTMLIIHIVSGAVWLIAIPFTRLSHMLWFGFTRSYMGSEFGAVRNSKDW